VSKKTRCRSKSWQAGWAAAENSFHHAMDINPSFSHPYIGYSELEPGESRSLVLGQVQNGIQAHHVQRLHHLFGGCKVAAFTSSLENRGMGPDKGADSGAIDPGDSGQINRQVSDPSSEQFV